MLGFSLLRPSTSLHVRSVVVAILPIYREVGMFGDTPSEYGVGRDGLNVSSWSTGETWRGL